MLEPSDYTPGIQTIADGLVMLGLAQALRLLLVLVTNTAKPFKPHSDIQGFGMRLGWAAQGPAAILARVRAAYPMPQLKRE